MDIPPPGRLSGHLSRASSMGEWSVLGSRRRSCYCGPGLWSLFRRRNLGGCVRCGAHSQRFSRSRGLFADPQSRWWKPSEGAGQTHRVCHLLAFLLASDPWVYRSSPSEFDTGGRNAPVPHLDGLSSRAVPPLAIFQTLGIVKEREKSVRQAATITIYVVWHGGITTSACACSQYALSVDHCCWVCPLGGRPRAQETGSWTRHSWWSATRIWRWPGIGLAYFLTATAYYPLCPKSLIMLLVYHGSSKLRVFLHNSSERGFLRLAATPRLTQIEFRTRHNA